MPTMPAGGRLIQLPLFAARPAAPAPAHDVHAISIPAREFTGDFYFVHESENRLWFAIGDVAGKGLPAAVIMAMIREELEQRVESCAAARCNPSATMLRLHAFLRPLVPANRFATAVIGLLCNDGTLEIANAGHCAPLIVRRNRTETIPSTGPVLGPLPFSRWQTFETRLGPGDALLLYSDGVLEAPSASGEEFGMARIEASARGRSAHGIAESVLTAVNRHTGGLRHDDLTIVALTRPAGRES
ncbi:MAG TPA: PP2C family protein-serine/threonine phosphatase [Thermoanaerobaculia bacterium]|nr:PP2C family protein-serine/threonine phosphatase [Thermoanaerobaculia bacterium]